MLRCALKNAWNGLPETVIVKRWHDREERFRRECACLDFLGREERIRDTFPTLFGWDAETGIMVVEDLGDREDQWLGHLVFRDDRERAEYALLEFQRSVGFMHAATMGKEEMFQDVLNLYDAEQDPEDHTDKLPRKIMLLGRNFGEFGFECVPGLDQDVEQILLLMHNPGPFFSFVHGDATLANSYLTQDGIRLFDLEYGGMRHCLTDGAFSRMRYLESSLTHQMPIELRRRMMQVYRKALASGCPEALDDDVFIPSFVACCACWMAMHCGQLRLHLERDEQWGRASMRQRVVTGLENFAQLSAEYRLFGALGETAAGLAQVLRQKWSEDECSLPLYTALS